MTLGPRWVASTKTLEKIGSRSSIFAGTALSGGIGFLVLGTSTKQEDEHITYDCWKPVVHDVSEEPSNGMYLKDLFSHQNIQKVTMATDCSTSLPNIVIENIWKEEFQIEYMMLNTTGEINNPHELLFVFITQKKIQDKNQENQAMQAGYSRDVFSSGFDTKFLCNYCGNILRDPVQSYCGHRFCRACIQGLVSSGDQRVQCLQCLTEGNADEEYSFINQDQIFPDMAVKREMSLIESKCVNPGCSWKGNFKHYEAHFKECKYQASPCTQCGNLITASKLNDHMKNECPMRRSDTLLNNSDIISKVNIRLLLGTFIIAKVDRNKFQNHVEQKPGLHIVHNLEQVTAISEKVAQIVAHLENTQSANNAGVITELRSKVQEQEQAIRRL
ncbi:TRAF2 [Mytilus edulis]|uniref:TRAF2 n=1 Tax=Mytilus edulis TaxID=6550 RepID=A0A8S3T6I4_MYTED|nr:TRAF2 [Mytilus edulis]